MAVGNVLVVGAHHAGKAQPDELHAQALDHALHGRRKPIIGFVLIAPHGVAAARDRDGRKDRDLGGHRRIAGVVVPRLGRGRLLRDLRDLDDLGRDEQVLEQRVPLLSRLAPQLAESRLRLRPDPLIAEDQHAMLQESLVEMFEGFFAHRAY